jgi:hypothetical protein
MNPTDTTFSEYPSLDSFPTPKQFPLSARDCKVLSALLDKFDVFDCYQYPRKTLVNELAEQIEMHPDDFYYSLKFLRMARFF